MKYKVTILTEMYVDASDMMDAEYVARSRFTQDPVVWEDVQVDIVEIHVCPKCGKTDVTKHCVDAPGCGHYFMCESCGEVFGSTVRDLIPEEVE